MIFLRRHLHEGLKAEYLTVKDPQILWSNLKDRYDHQKTVILPKARYEWTHLRLQDFKSVADYNSAMFRITSKLKLCGENISDADMLEKTYTTFHANNVVLQTQYREKGFKKYSELISCLLVAEQNNELLMKNHESRPTGSAPFPEANVTSFHRKGQHHERGNGFSGRGRGRGRGHGRGFGRGRGGSFKNSNSHQQWEGKDANKQENVNNVCFRCGGNGHWSRTCRTPKHIVELYQQLMQQKEKKAEANHLGYEDFSLGDFSLEDFDHGDATHLETAHFIAPEVEE